MKPQQAIGVKGVCGFVAPVSRYAADPRWHLLQLLSYHVAVLRGTDGSAPESGKAGGGW